jgi:FtsP/CotA-like multicopper oxidase with cupredoxin domain
MMSAQRQDRRIDRRRFLGLGARVAATAGLAACSSTADTANTANGPSRIDPGSPKVADAERARRGANARVATVDLDAVAGEVDLGGLTVNTWTYGGLLPGREIRVTRGDVLRVRLRNRLPQPTTIHWHGLALRNDMDGVPDLTQRQIDPNSEFTYEFTVPDAGTYWFHPHVGTQLDRGLYAPLIVEDPADGGDYDSDLVVVLDDWLDGLGRDPDGVLKELQENGMTMRGGTSMPGMDHGSGMPQSELLGGDSGDVTYPHMLANGHVPGVPWTLSTKPGQRIRLRLINAAADTVFRVGIPSVSMRVTHTDGFPVTARQADVVLLGMGERIDAVITVPDTAVPILALAEGRDAYAQVLIQTPTSRTAPVNDAVIQQLGTLPVLTVADLEAAEQVRFADKAPDVTHDLVLEGPGEKYRWTINGKTYDPRDGLPVREGQRVRLRIQNKSTMFHPMHLHGHTFQVRTQANRDPRKDTVIVLPGRSLEVDFDADNPGQWLTHCHNVYHGEAGMMTVLSYVE